MTGDIEPLDAGQRAAVALVTVALDSVLSADRHVDHVAIDAVFTDAGGLSGSAGEVIAWNAAVCCALVLRSVCEEGDEDPRLLWQRFVAGLAVAMGEDA